MGIVKLDQMKYLCWILVEWEIKWKLGHSGDDKRSLECNGEAVSVLEISGYIKKPSDDSWPVSHIMHVKKQVKSGTWNW